MRTISPRVTHITELDTRINQINLNLWAPDPQSNRNPRKFGIAELKVILSFFYDGIFSFFHHLRQLQQQQQHFFCDYCHPGVIGVGKQHYLQSISVGSGFISGH